MSARFAGIDEGSHLVRCSRSSEMVNAAGVGAQPLVGKGHERTCDVTGFFLPSIRDRSATVKVPVLMGLGEGRQRDI